MQSPFPHDYTIELAPGTDLRTVLRVPPVGEVEGGPPPEFGGADSWWTPEHLIGSALGLCLKLTYLAIAKRARLDVRQYSSRVTTTVDRTEVGFRMTRFKVELDVEVAAADVEKARTVADSAKKHCIVSNSIDTPIVLKVQVSGV
ncbi:MAG: OsmC family protein [Planctomycetota bacterium]